ncbi:MAG: cation:proton antiporter [Proteobacteria bacterium]|nr:cation:proton antiporter [Pseudomonadota bacterium]
MPQNPFFPEFLIILIAATVVALAFERIRMPVMLGFLLAGVVIGPHGLRFITDSQRIHTFAEIGIILLMLTIGLEFSFSRLKGLRNIGIFGGGAQIILSIAIAMLAARIIGWSYYAGFVFGSVIALSSTAIVMKYLTDGAELDTQYGRIAVAILIFQDLAVVPLMILITTLGESTGSVAVRLLWALMKATLFFGGIIIFARYLLPRFFKRIARSRSREMFLLSAVVVIFGAAWLSGQLGLSMAIGAFIAGVMFADTDFGNRLVSETISFRHIFVSLFFVSIGLLFDPRFAALHGGIIATIVGLVLLVNCVVTAIVVICCGYSVRIALATGIILAQIGEFSFLLLEASRLSGGLDKYFYQVLLSSAFLTMFLTPFLFSLLPRLMQFSERIPLFGKSLGSAQGATEHYRSELAGHVILCGFGPLGTDLALAFREQNIPFIIVEMNHRLVGDAQKQSFPVLYGDAANEEILKKAGINKARSLVVTFADPAGMAQIVRVVQVLNPDMFIAVRSRFERDVPWLYELGVDAVVMEELEASCELNRIILEHVGVEQKQIEQYLNRIRQRKELTIEAAIFKSTQSRT